jgi:hypothetical protein
LRAWPNTWHGRAKPGITRNLDPCFLAPVWQNGWQYPAGPGNPLAAHYGIGRHYAAISGKASKRPVPHGVAATMARHGTERHRPAKLVWPELAASHAKLSMGSATASHHLKPGALTLRPQDEDAASNLSKNPLSRASFSAFAPRSLRSASWRSPMRVCARHASHFCEAMNHRCSIASLLAFHAMHCNASRLAWVQCNATREWRQPELP